VQWVLQISESHVQMIFQLETQSVEKHYHVGCTIASSHDIKDHVSFVKFQLSINVDEEKVKERSIDMNSNIQLIL
jgi:hypothetical protein